ncbi:tektin family protein [Candidatus Babeliales bacterium]|nr:tektin family protein [Candidatus Babeliales bacterium]MCF7899501.1 tektin family protein [Candidatus Babeliales bacterium]
MKSFIYNFIILSIISNSIFASKSQEFIQKLHKNIGDDLLSIKKEFPPSQSKVYTTLDQVCKIYQVAKKNIEKKRKLKEIIKVKDEQYKTLTSKTNLLKNQFTDLIKELETSKQNLLSLNKKLEKKEITLTMLKQEKNNLNKESNIKKNDLNLANTDNDQSLNLTSTWEPSSPL